MSAAERKALANKILDMDYDSQRQLVEQLSGIVELNAKLKPKQAASKPPLLVSTPAKQTWQVAAMLSPC